MHSPGILSSVHSAALLPRLSAVVMSMCGLCALCVARVSLRQRSLFLLSGRAAVPGGDEKQSEGHVYARALGSRVRSDDDHQRGRVRRSPSTLHARSHAPFQKRHTHVRVQLVGFSLC